MLGACLPLLEEARVEALEWSFDALYKTEEIPPWFRDLLTAFSKENRLIGHGVFFSLFAGRWQPEQQAWLQHLRTSCDTFHFDHITEHFGFMTGLDFHQGAPLNIPYTTSTLAIGQDRLKRIYDACACPVGLENLAFAYSIEDVQRQGAFLNELLRPINGFIILDLHNLWCQLHNFAIPYEQLIGLYPLDRVREIHISGGTWDDSMLEAGRRIRRDTHDDAVPKEVFDLLRQTIGRCPQLKYVVMEQLDNGLTSHKSKQQFYGDFLAMESIVDAANKQERPAPFQTFLPSGPLHVGEPVEDETLYQQQRVLADILESASSFDAARIQLLSSSLAGTAWHVEQWDAAMIETAVKIAQKWKEGF